MGTILGIRGSAQGSHQDFLPGKKEKSFSLDLELSCHIEQTDQTFTMCYPVRNGILTKVFKLRYLIYHLIFVK